MQKLIEILRYLNFYRLVAGGPHVNHSLQLISKEEILFILFSLVSEPHYLMKANKLSNNGTIVMIFPFY
jgi:hypothetical protein